MTREICKGCGRINPVGFSVPDAVWHAATDGFDGVLCLMCFAQRADDAGVAWDREIEFYPVSLSTHSEITHHRDSTHSLFTNSEQNEILNTV